MEEYEYLTTLGEGAYGFVWKCEERATGQLVAIKGLKQAHVEPEILRMAVREVRVLQTLKHPAIIHLIEAFKSKSGRVYMVFPYVGHSAFQELDDHPKGLPPTRLKLLVWQLLQALTYLHRRKVVHRDIKPANILLSESGEVKLCDFGFARTTRCGPREAEKMTSYVVTRWYRAPELLVGEPYGPASDIWSLGCTVAELATGQPLFPGKSTCEQLWRIMRCFGSLPHSQAARLAKDPRLERARAPARGRSLRERLKQDCCEQGLFQLIEACLQLEPRHRPTAEELLQSPYLWGVPKLLEGTALGQLYDGLLQEQRIGEQQPQQQQPDHHQWQQQQLALERLQQARATATAVLGKAPSPPATPGDVAQAKRQGRGGKPRPSAPGGLRMTHQAGAGAGAGAFGSLADSLGRPSAPEGAAHKGGHRQHQQHQGVQEEDGKDEGSDSEGSLSNCSLLPMSPTDLGGGKVQALLQQRRMCSAAVDVAATATDARAAAVGPEGAVVTGETWRQQPQRIGRQGSQPASRGEGDGSARDAIRALRTVDTLVPERFARQEATSQGHGASGRAPSAQVAGLGGAGSAVGGGCGGCSAPAAAQASASGAAAAAVEAHAATATSPSKPTTPSPPLPLQQCRQRRDAGGPVNASGGGDGDGGGGGDGGGRNCTSHAPAPRSSAKPTDPAYDAVRSSAVQSASAWGVAWGISAGSAAQRAPSTTVGVPDPPPPPLLPPPPPPVVTISIPLSHTRRAGQVPPSDRVASCGQLSLTAIPDSATTLDATLTTSRTDSGSGADMRGHQVVLTLRGTGPLESRANAPPDLAARLRSGPPAPNPCCSDPAGAVTAAAVAAAATACLCGQLLPGNTGDTSGHPPYSTPMSQALELRRDSTLDRLVRSTGTAREWPWRSSPEDLLLSQSVNKALSAGVAAAAPIIACRRRPGAAAPAAAAAAAAVTGVTVAAASAPAALALATGPLATGPLATGPLATGPLATGPLATGPLATGPLATGPLATAGAAAGPLATGPLATGPLATGPLATAGAAAVLQDGSLVFVGDDEPVAFDTSTCASNYNIRTSAGATATASASQLRTDCEAAGRPCLQYQPSPQLQRLPSSLTAARRYMARGSVTHSAIATPNKEFACDGTFGGNGVGGQSVGPTTAGAGRVLGSGPVMHAWGGSRESATRSQSLSAAAPTTAAVLRWAGKTGMESHDGLMPCSPGDAVVAGPAATAAAAALGRAAGDALPFGGFPQHADVLAAAVGSSSSLRLGSGTSTKVAPACMAVPALAPFTVAVAATASTSNPSRSRLFGVAPNNAQPSRWDTSAVTEVPTSPILALCACPDNAPLSEPPGGPPPPPLQPPPPSLPPSTMTPVLAAASSSGSSRRRATSAAGVAAVAAVAEDVYELCDGGGGKPGSATARLQGRRVTACKSEGSRRTAPVTAVYGFPEDEGVSGGGRKGALTRLLGVVKKVFTGSRGRPSPP